MFPRPIFPRYVTIISVTLAVFEFSSRIEATCKPQFGGKTTCNIGGRVQEAYYVGWATGQPQIVDGPEECARLCARRVFNASTTYALGAGYCTSFRFDQRTNLCQLGTFPVNESITVTGNKDHRYYDSDCYDCGAYCDQPYGSQLLDNGGFQDDLLGPWEASGARVGRGPNGQRFYHCYSAGCNLLQKFNICPDSLYMLEFEYIILADVPVPPPFPPFLDITFGSSALLYVQNNSDRTWKSLKLFHKPSAEEDGFVYNPGGFQFEQSGYTDHKDHQIFLDNVRVSRIPINPKLKTPVRNLFKNPGFETGHLRPWSTSQRVDQFDSGNFTIVSPGINSSYSIHYKSHVFGFFETPYLQQTVTTIPFATYLFSFDVNTTVTNFARWQVFFDIGTDELYFSHILLLDPGSYSYAVPVQVTTTSTFMRLYATSDSNPGYIYLDNFQLAEIEKSEYFP